MAWGELLLDYGAAGKSREIRASGGNKKQMSSEAEAGGRHRDAWGKKKGKERRKEESQELQGEVKTKPGMKWKQRGARSKVSKKCGSSWWRKVMSHR